MPPSGIPSQGHAPLCAMIMPSLSEAFPRSRGSQMPSLMQMPTFDPARPKPKTRVAWMMSAPRGTGGAEMSSSGMRWEGSFRQTGRCHVA